MFHSSLIEFDRRLPEASSGILMSGVVRRMRNGLARTHS